MSALSKLLHKQLMRELILENTEREIGKQIFDELRQRTIALLCAYIRMLRQSKQCGLRHKEIYRDADWCNAAVQLLIYAPQYVQDEYLRGDDHIKNELICAVLADRGILASDDHFYELSPL